MWHGWIGFVTHQAKVKFMSYLEREALSLVRGSLVYNVHIKDEDYGFVKGLFPDACWNLAHFDINGIPTGEIDSNTSISVEDRNKLYQTFRHNKNS